MSEPLRLGLLGDPVGHSLSPALQRAALAALGLAGDYTLHRTPAAELAARLTELAAGGWLGLNLTVPLKQAGYSLLSVERLSREALATGAVNTLRLDAGGWSGHNTDPEGFRAAAQALAGDLRGLRVVLLGAGGAARAVMLALAEAGAASVAVWNRSPARLRAMLESMAASMGACAATALPADMTRCPAATDLIVQATSLGILAGDALPPLPADGSTAFALDLVTSPTPWQDACGAIGCAVADGREMLLGQGAAAFSYWTSREAPLAAMRSALFGS